MLDDCLTQGAVIPARAHKHTHTHAPQTCILAQKIGGTFNMGELIRRGWLPADFDFARNVVAVPVCVCALVSPAENAPVVR